MAKIRQTAFAAVNTAANPPHISAWTISGTATIVRLKVGKGWNLEDPKNGWKAAKTYGMRVVKIEMTAERP